MIDAQLPIGIVGYYARLVMFSFDGLLIYGINTSKEVAIQK